jgi:toxin FitB
MTQFRRADLNEWLALEARPMFEGRALQVTEDILVKWRLLAAAGRKVGRTYSEPDLVIAATALHHSLGVVTRDRSVFDRVGARVFNPWTDPPPT